MADKSKTIRYLCISIIWLMVLPAAIGQKAFTQYEKIVFGCYSEDIEEFSDFSRQAKAIGATHITITAEDLPIAYHDLTPPEDPYPAWIITNPGLLKICPPELLEPFLAGEYSKKFMDILELRNKVLLNLDLKAAFHTFEPQELPEPVFSKYPSWRGPQVDNPLRSRQARFAPSMTHPDVLRLYSESMQQLIQRCPTIDILQMRTNDSGAGIEWSNGLYAGPNGNINTRSMNMGDRISIYLSSLQDAAVNAGGSLDVHLYNCKEDRPDIIAQSLRSNMAADNYEGPAGSRFKSDVGSLLYYRRPYAPVPGIPWPVTFLNELESANSRSAERLFINIGDRLNRDLYLDLYELFVENPTDTHSERYGLLMKLASRRVGDEYAEELVNMWLSLHQVEKTADFFSMGGTVFILGPVHQRWLTRPFVPFPDSLSSEERDYYRKHQFQARTEANANDLLDLQGSRLINGFGGYSVARRALYSIRRDLYAARSSLRIIQEGLDGEMKEKYQLLETRLEIFGCLVKNVDHAIHYQVVLDRALLHNDNAEHNPSYHFIQPVDIKSRQELKKIARAEMDNITYLKLLLETKADTSLIDKAKVKEDEYHRLLGPDLTDQLYKKLIIMREYWEDYKYIWTN